MMLCVLLKFRWFFFAIRSYTPPVSPFAAVGRVPVGVIAEALGWGSGDLD